MTQKVESKYDPDTWDGTGKLPKLYSRTATGAINIWEVGLDGKGSVIVQWGQLGGSLQKSTFKCEAKNVGRSNATDAQQQSRLEAIAKWRKQLKKKYYENLDEAEGPHLRPMLAQVFKNRKDKVTYPVHVQPKLNGVRCLAYKEPFKNGGRLSLYSRGGDVYDVEHIRASLDEVLEDGVVLDGELYIHGMGLQKIVSLVKCPQEDSSRLTYNVYDMFHSDGLTETWGERLINLESWFDYAKGVGLSPSIGRVPTGIARYEEEVNSSHNTYVMNGYEGCIVRIINGTYRIGYRSPDLLKVKQFDDDEFIIVGWTTGKGKFLHVPIFKCKTKDGKEFEVTPRGTEEERANLLRNAGTMIGKPYTVRYFGFTEEGKPFHPVGIGVREKGT
jgi:DNA ligase 1